MSSVTEYLNNTELPNNYRDKKLIKFKGFKNNGKAEGPCIIGYILEYYYHEEVNFIDDKKNGPYKTYWVTNFIEEGIYENDKKNGPYKKYDIDGNIEEEGIYVNDEKNGPYKIYHENGNIYEEGIYLNDKKIEIIIY